MHFQDEVGFPFLQGLPAVIRSFGALAFYAARKGRKHRARLRRRKAARKRSQGEAFEPRSRATA